MTRGLWIVLTKLMGMNKVGNRSCVCKPLQIDSPKGISIGTYSFVGHYSWLMGGTNKNDKGLTIGDNVTIGHFSHIIATKEVTIENDVLIADRVYISDCSHCYKDVKIPVQKQPVEFIKPVCIGEGAWIGENVCVCGANIGKHSVIGANSVVTKDIPDACVAAGVPAKVIKKYDQNMGQWQTV